MHGFGELEQQALAPPDRRIGGAQQEHVGRVAGGDHRLHLLAVLTGDVAEGGVHPALTEARELGGVGGVVVGGRSRLKLIRLLPDTVQSAQPAMVSVS